jgi:hypothetical protein
MSRDRIVWGVVAGWALMVVAGFAILGMYKAAPGEAAQPEPVWPAGVGLTRSPDKATLIMFAHPNCPCTKASVAELARLMAQVGDRVVAHVAFTRPAGVGADWAETDLWDAARRIPGVTVGWDDEGLQAKRFDASTSGQVVLYDAGGKRLFAGGITGSRGHEGDNLGRSRIVALLTEGTVDAPESPVFGCALSEHAGRE